MHALLWSNGVMLRIAVFAAELLLSALLITWMRSSLRGHTEPLRFMMPLFAYGALAAAMSAFVEIRYSFNLNQLAITHPALISDYGLGLQVLNGCSAALIEELAKYLVALIAIMNAGHFQRLSTAITYLIIIGLGFSLVEDFIFLLNPDTVPIYRLFSFFVHSGTSAIIGYSLGRFRFGLSRYRDLLMAIVGAILMHVAYNMAVAQPDYQVALYTTLGLTIFITSRVFVLFHRTVNEEWRLEEEMFQGGNSQKLLHLPAKRSAFTLIELLITVAVIGILSSIAFVAATSYLASARDSTRLFNVNYYYSAVMDRESTTGTYFIESTTGGGCNADSAAPLPPGHIYSEAGQGCVGEWGNSSGIITATDATEPDLGYNPTTSIAGALQADGYINAIVTDPLTPKQSSYPDLFYAICDSSGQITTDKPDAVHFSILAKLEDPTSTQTSQEDTSCGGAHSGQ